MSTKKTIPLIILAIFTLVLAGTYGRWEYLSFKYSEEFIEPIKSSIDEGCFLETPVKIKVMKYADNEATVFIKGESGSTYLISFQRLDSGWSLLKTSGTSGNEYCDFEILNSTLGGSADSYYFFGQK
jgi:hypothetical protein